MNTGQHKKFLLLLSIFVSLPLLSFANAVSAESRGISIQAIEKNPLTPFVSGSYRAVIIGNNQYRDPKGKWPNLQTAVSDAKAVSQLLKNNYGFDDITLIENASRRDILLALAELNRKVMPNDSVLVYYAGHGYLDPETKRGYWVPIDAEGTDQTTFLRNSTIRDEMNSIATRGRHTLLIADSCFSGSLLRSGTRGMPADISTEKYYEKVAQKKSVQIMTAGGVEYVDDDYQTSGHSPFTYFLLNELKHNNSPLLTVSELSQNVEKAVANNAPQVPESGVLQGAGDELGEFIFVNVDVSVQGVPPERVKVKVNVVPDITDTTDSSTPTHVIEESAPGAPGKNPLPIPTL